MKIDLLVAEIGSTTTLVNAFNIIDTCPRYLGQGQSATTVLEGDVNIGLNDAIKNLSVNLGSDICDIEYLELMATSSAAGGLKMTVHGLVYDMTVKAAKEAALGAGANINLITAGKLRESDLDKILEIKPNIILIAGGVDFGERDTAIHNAKLIVSLDMDVPIIYAGNIENREEIKGILKSNNKEFYIVDNVYPRIDELNIEPTRKIIQKVFESHIIHGPGMSKIRNLVDGYIMPTPGAVMEASKLLYNDMGDLLTIDVGGATTDIHSVTEGSEEIARISMNPEPKAKRTVEGDLGVYINRKNVIQLIGRDKFCEELGLSIEELDEFIEKINPVPTNDMERVFMNLLTNYCADIALHRHGGRLRDLYTISGKKTIAEGKDLTLVKYIIGTGGALSKLNIDKDRIIDILKNSKGNYLLPREENIQYLVDKDYIMASLGVMAKKYPKASLQLLKNSLR